MSGDEQNKDEEIDAPIEFHGCIEKLNRCADLLTELSNLVMEFLAQCAITQENQPAKSRYAFWVDGPFVPLRISIQAGEILHHMRSCLDHILWAVAEHDPGKVNTRLQFPIYDTEEEFKRKISEKSFYGIPDEYKHLLAKLQPYTVTPLEGSILRQIQKLNNIDKHRLLLVASTALMVGNFQSLAAGQNITTYLPPAETGSIYFSGIEDGKEIHWLSYSPPMENLKIEANHSVMLTLGDMGVKNELIEALSVFLHYTTKVVINFIDEFNKAVQPSDSQQ